MATQLGSGGTRIQAEPCDSEATMLSFFLTCQPPAKPEIILLVPLTFQGISSLGPVCLQASKTEAYKCTQICS